MGNLLTPTYKNSVSPKTIVVLGSSNSAGYQASTFTTDPAPSGPGAYGQLGGYGSASTSWVGLLSTALKAIDPAWTVINRSISGTGVNQSIERFESHVVPYKPSHVILCTAVSNDGVQTYAIYEGTKKLIKMCRDIGAIPIVRGGYAWNGYSAAQYQQVLALNQQFDNLGVWRIDHFSALDDGTGKIVGGSKYQIGDGLHVNDLGMKIMFNAIDLGMFIRGSDYVRRENRPGSWQFNASSALNGSSIVVCPSTPVYGVNSGLIGGLLGAGLTSFTMRMRLKGALASANLPNSRAFMTAYMDGTNATSLNAVPLRIRNPTGFLQMSDNNDIGAVSTINPTNDASPHDIVMTYNEATNIAAYYIDGTLIGSGPINGPGNSIPIGPSLYFGFGGRINPGEGGFIGGYGVSDVGLWASPLTSTAIADMARTGRKPPASMIVDAVMSSSPCNGGYVPNAIDNGVYPVILADTPFNAIPTF